MHRENHSIALQWFKAFNHKDLRGLLSLYHDDARDYDPSQSPETEGWITGKVNIGRSFDEIFQRYDRLRNVAGKIITDPNHVWAEYVRIADQEPQSVVKKEFDIVERRIKESRVIPQASKD
jgi:hypothetical protein